MSIFFLGWGWHRTRHMFPHELAVLRLLLPAADRRSADLYRQATDAPSITRRLINGTTFEAVIPYVLDDRLLIDCDEMMISPTIKIVDRRSYSDLIFSTKVLRGGFLSGLIGSTSQLQEWPKKWFVDPREIADKRIRGTDNWLGPYYETGANQLDQLAAWLQLPSSTSRELPEDAFQFRPPATLIEVEDCERRLGRRLPLAVKNLLHISNGFTVVGRQQINLFGTEDIYYLRCKNSLVLSIDADATIVVKEVGEGQAEASYIDISNQVEYFAGTLHEVVAELTRQTFIE